MKLNNLVFDFDKFAVEMANLKEKKHFDYLVTIVGEDFGPEEEHAHTDGGHGAQPGKAAPDRVLL